MTAEDVYQLFAIRYARHDRPASANFIGGDPHDGPMPLDYFVWLALGQTRSFVVDTGFTKAAAEARGREFLRCPTEGLRALGFEAREARDVVLTHLHYDHAGNLDLFPNAVFHVQDREMSFATGRHMRHAHLRAPLAVEDVVTLVRQVYKERVRFHDGDGELAPGLTLHHIGGHTPGLQVVRVRTRRGWVVVASDATHLYANLEQGRPFPIVFDVAAMLEGYDRLRALAETPAHIIPGHDPEVMRRYPPPRPDLDGICVRLDVEPRG